MLKGAGIQGTALASLVDCRSTTARGPRAQCPRTTILRPRTETVRSRLPTDPSICLRECERIEARRAETTKEARFTRAVPKASPNIASWPAGKNQRVESQNFLGAETPRGVAHAHPHPVPCFQNQGPPDLHA